MNVRILILAATIVFGRSYFKEIRSLIDEGEPEQALQIINARLPETSGKKRQTLLELAVMASMKAGDWEGVLSYGNEFVREFPDSKKVGEIRFFMAKAYLAMGRKDDAAVEMLKAYSSRGPSWVKDSSYTYLFGIVNIETNLFNSLISRGYLDKRVTPTMKVAVIVPRSGPLAPLGDEFMRGFLMAVPVNIELQVFDTQSDTAYASLLADRLRDSIFSVVIGPITSIFARKMSPVFDSVALFDLVPAAADLRLGDIGMFVIPFNYTLKLEVEKLASYAMDSLGADRFFILYPPEARYVAAAFYFKQLIESRDGTVLDAVKIPDEGLPFRDEMELIRRIGKAENSVVFVPSGNRGIYSMMGQMKFYDVNPIVLGCDGWLNWHRKNELNIVIASPPPGEPDVDREAMINNFMEIHKARPSTIAMVGYDAGVIVTRLLNQGPISSLSAWQKADSIGIFRGVAGDYVLSKRKDFIKLYSFGHIELSKGGNQWQPNVQGE